MESLPDLLEVLYGRCEAFERAAHGIFGRLESSAGSRIMSVDQSRRKLSFLSLEQDDLIEQALRCIEHGINRAAHVMAWAAFVDMLEKKLASDGFVKLHKLRPAWAKHSTVEELRENVVEYQLVEAARDLRLFGKVEARSILGLLSRRNECAHPGSYSPNTNETLGYVCEILNRAQALASKTL